MNKRQKAIALAFLVGIGAGIVLLSIALELGGQCPGL